MEPTSSETTWTRGADVLEPGRTAEFERLDGGRRAHAFLVNHEGHHQAYLNRCPHAGSALDGRPNEFFTEDGRHLVCTTHGAVFAPDTGLCLEGPCPGARLERVAVARRGRALVVGP